MKTLVYMTAGAICLPLFVGLLFLIGAGLAYLKAAYGAIVLCSIIIAIVGAILGFCIKGAVE